MNPTPSHSDVHHEGGLRAVLDTVVHELDETIHPLGAVNDPYAKFRRADPTQAMESGCYSMAIALIGAIAAWFAQSTVTLITAVIVAILLPKVWKVCRSRVLKSGR
jgi:hypothetical protein